MEEAQGRERGSTHPRRDGPRLCADHVLRRPDPVVRDERMARLHSSCRSCSRASLQTIQSDHRFVPVVALAHPRRGRRGRRARRHAVDARELRPKANAALARQTDRDRHRRLSLPASRRVLLTSDVGPACSSSRSMRHALRWLTVPVPSRRVDHPEAGAPRLVGFIRRAEPSTLAVGFSDREQSETVVDRRIDDPLRHQR